jgi:hypothetical protein
MNNEEDHEQSVVVDWLDRHGVLFTAVPLGGKRNVITAARLKRLGAKKGVPDILIFDPPPGDAAIGVAIEMKRRSGGTVRPEQREWLEKLDARGWVSLICRGADQAIEELTKLGYGGK